MTRPPTADDIRRAVGTASYQRGDRYQRDGHAELLGGGLAVGRLRGVVEGSAATPYEVTVEIKARSGGVAIVGTCSCPIGFNCKHVAALLLEALRHPPAAAAAPVAAAPSFSPALPHTVTAWLAALDRAAQAGEDYPREVRQRMLYVLRLDRALSDDGLVTMVTPTSVRLRKDDTITDAKGYDPANAMVYSPAKYLRPSDLVILRRLAIERPHHGLSRAHGLQGADAAAILEKIVETGRGAWESHEGPRLRKAPPCPGRISWRLGADGRLMPRVAVEGLPDAVVLPLAPPWYVDAATGACGPLELGLAPAVAEALLRAPPLPAAQAPAVRERLARLLPERPELLPPELGAARRVGGTPQPRLRLHVREIHRDPRKGYFYNPHAKAGPQEVWLARLSFRYEDIEVAEASHPEPLQTISRDGALIELRRAPEAERQAGERLFAAGLVRLRTEYEYSPPPDCLEDRVMRGRGEGAWVEFFAEQLPRLREAGWLVEVPADFPLRVADPDLQLRAELVPSAEAASGTDWFDLSIGVMVDGERIDILPALLRLLRQGGDPAAARTITVRLADGRALALPGERIAPIAQALLALFDEEPPEDGAVRLDRRRAVDTALLEEVTGAAGLQWQGGEALREMGRILRDHRGIPHVAVPEGFQGTLRDYQHQGLDWMQFLRGVGLGGILADDMGLGKTVQVLAHLSVEQAAGRLDRPCLVVAPTSLMPNWRREAHAFAPGLRVLLLHGQERKKDFGRLAEHDLVLTTYALVSRDIKVLEAQPWHSVIADEAQFAKNPDTGTAKALRRLQAEHRLCLTGTPVENHLGELWALFDFAAPGLLAGRAAFSRGWRTPIEKKGDEERRLQLARRIRPFLLRRTKDQVAAELPPKTEILETVELEGGQRDLYETIRLAMHAKVRQAIERKGLARSRIDFLDALLKLRQACCDPRLVKSAAARHAKAGSAKLGRLMEMLPELAEEGRRVLVFSQFTSMLDLIEPELMQAGLGFVRISGNTRDRDTPVRRFQAGEVPVFLISLKAGGTGLTLTAADTVIHYDPWWNPAVEAQATDRAHRIGQTKAVFVHKLIAEGTVEEKIIELQARKKGLADGLLDPEAGGGFDLGDEDVEFLLG